MNTTMDCHFSQQLSHLAIVRELQGSSSLSPSTITPSTVITSNSVREVKTITLLMNLGKQVRLDCSPLETIYNVFKHFLAIKLGKKSVQKHDMLPYCIVLAGNPPKMLQLAQTVRKCKLENNTLLDSR